MRLNKKSSSAKLQTTGMCLLFILKSNKKVKYYNKLLEDVRRSPQKAGGITSSVREGM